METKKSPTIKELLEKAKQLPLKPGVYLMKDSKEAVIYVGKAKALKNRVSSYFQKQHGTERKTVVMVSKVYDIDTIVTATEKEALLLENNLIKEYRPRFNVVFRDDKEYPYLRLSVKESFPNLTIARKPKKDGNLYFGPFASAQAVRETLKVIKKLFPLRKCSTRKMNNKRPCMYYQLGQCFAPCSKEVAKEDYFQVVQDVRLFLQGRKTEIIPQLKKRMAKASEDLDFELAAQLRDRISGIEKTLEKQIIVHNDFTDRDVFSFFRENNQVGITALFIRAGRMTGSRHFFLKNVLLSDEEVMTSFISQYYLQDEFIPDEVLLPFESKEKNFLEEFLKDKKGSSIKIIVPKQGAKKKLLDMAENNAKIMFQKNRSQEKNVEDLLKDLGKRLHLNRYPARIECFDISNIMGTSAVGSMVVFENGKPSKQDYRKFKIKSIEQPNDYAMMNEVLTRRLNRIKKGESAPDLILVDGGKGQLGILLKVLQEHHADEICAAALAKGRQDKDIGKKDDEKVFIPKRKNPVVFPKGSKALFLLQQLRDEAHRFAISYHKVLKRSKDFTSEIENIPGIGKKTVSVVLKHFGSLKNVKKATLTELERVPSVTKKRAADMYYFFQAEKGI
jgi:excinuclease ABC subunit C